MRTSRTQPIDWLFPRVRKRVLTLLLMSADKSWHLREIVRRTGYAIGTVRRELKGLAACGIVLERRDGNRVLFQANRQCPIYPDLLGLVRKTCGLADVLREALAPLGGQVVVAFVHGSMARNEAQAGSDVDLIVIGLVKFGDIVSKLASAQETLGREVNPTVYSPSEFRLKVDAGHHFLTSVLAEPKIFLIGDPHELERLAQ